MAGPVPPTPSLATGRSAADRLDSWKEIAAHLKRDVRTVQRWEKDHALPVQRHVNAKQGSLFGYKEELEAWWNDRRGELESQGVQPRRTVLRRFARSDAAWTIAWSHHRRCESRDGEEEDPGRRSDGGSQCCARNGSLSRHVARWQQAGFVTGWFSVGIRRQERRSGATLSASLHPPIALFQDTYVPGEPLHPNYDVSPDGSHFLMIKGERPDRVSEIRVLQGWKTKLASLLQ